MLLFNEIVHFLAKKKKKAIYLQEQQWKTKLTKRWEARSDYQLKNEEMQDPQERDRDSCSQRGYSKNQGNVKSSHFVVCFGKWCLNDKG